MNLPLDLDHISYISRNSVPQTRYRAEGVPDVTGTDFGCINERNCALSLESALRCSTYRYGYYVNFFLINRGDLNEIQNKSFSFTLLE